MLGFVIVSPLVNQSRLTVFERSTMPSSLEQNYHRINKILSITIAGLLAIIGGAWVLQNKNLVFRSPVKWMIDEATKEDASIPKMEPIKGLEIGDPSVFTKGVYLGPDKMEEFGKYSSTPSSVPSGKPPAHNNSKKGNK
jgi:hypothetical protein